MTKKAKRKLNKALRNLVGYRTKKDLKAFRRALIEAVKS